MVVLNYSSSDCDVLVFSYYGGPLDLSSEVTEKKQ